MKKFVLLFTVFLTAISCSKEKTSLFNTWKLKSYLKGPGEVVVNSGFKFEISFSKDSSYNALLDINSCSGTFLKSASELTINEGFCTETCCDQDNSLEAFKLFTDSVNKYEISGNNLKLKGNTYIILEFELEK